MAKFIVDLYLDGYDSEEEMIEACEEFIYEQLNFSASSVLVERFEEKKGEWVFNSIKGEWLWMDNETQRLHGK